MLSLLLSLALSACATIEQTEPVPAGAQLMSAGEVSALLSRPATFNNAIFGGMRSEFSPDGRVRYSMRMLPVRKTGRWQLDGDRLCINVDSDPWDCGNLYRFSKSRFYFALRGYGQDYNTLELQ
jgi:hypothetical protein